MQREVRITLAELHTAQRRVEDEARRFNVLCCGRRWGKNILGQNKAIERAIGSPDIAGGPVAWFAPTYKMLSDDWRDIRHITAPITRKVSEQEKRIELAGGGVIEMWSLDNQDTARGRKYARAIINEAGMIANLVDAWNMVIRPTLMDYTGDAWFLSTPRGLNGFYSLWQEAESNPDWARWRYPSDANPFINPDEIAAIRADLPERVVRQEIDAEFVEDGAYFQRVDEAAMIDAPDDPALHDGHSLFMGVDWAKSADYTVMAVACRECNRIVDWERFNRVDYTYQRERLYSLADRWHIKGAMPERNSIGEPNIEIISQRVRVLRGPDGLMGWNTTAATKPVLIEDLARAMEHDGWKVPKAAADELRSYDVVTGDSGHPKFSAPAGRHDDWVIALALTWQAAKRPRGVGLV